MIRLRLTLDSTLMLRPVPVEAAVPYGFQGGTGPWRTVWALHCAMADGNFFFERLGAGRLADRENLVFIAPSLGNSYFVNGGEERIADFLQLELMPILRDLLPLSSARADNALLGISMGAYGAVRWACVEPENFCAVAAISGVYNCLMPPDERLRGQRELCALRAAFEGRMRSRLLDDHGKPRPDADLERLLHACDAETLPRLMVWCGESDYLSLRQSEALVDRWRAHGGLARFTPVPGAHDDSLWREILAGASTALFAQPNPEGEHDVPDTCDGIF